MAITIPPLDAMFFLSEMPASPKHVGALQIFELPPRAPKDYLKQLVARMKSQPPAPPFNYRPIFPRAGMPQWQVEEDVDMDYHVRHSALPAPGDTRQLLDLVERLHGGMLDRQRPCWFCQVIEGLEGNRFAVYSKVHHSLIDGMSGVRRMHAALSGSPRSTAFQAPWAFEEQRAPRRPDADAASRFADVGRTALAQARAAVELSGTLARMGLQWMKIQDSFHQVPFDAPRSLMNRPLTRDARAVGICTLPLDRVKAAGRDARRHGERCAARRRRRGLAHVSRALRRALRFPAGGPVSDVAARGRRRRGQRQGLGAARATRRAADGHAHAPRAGDRLVDEVETGGAGDVAQRADGLRRADVRRLRTVRAHRAAAAVAGLLQRADVERARPRGRAHVPARLAPDRQLPDIDLPARHEPQRHGALARQQHRCRRDDGPARDARRRAPGRIDRAALRRTRARAREASREPCASRQEYAP